MKKTGFILSVFVLIACSGKQTTTGTTAEDFQKMYAIWQCVDAGTAEFHEFTPDLLADFNYPNFEAKEVYRINKLKLLFGHYSVVEEEEESNVAVPVLYPETDKGTGFIGLNAKNKLIFRTMGCPYNIMPRFFISSDKKQIVILVQIDGFEYSTEVYLIENDQMYSIGSLYIQPYRVIDNGENFSLIRERQFIGSIAKIKRTNSTLEVSFDADSSVQCYIGGRGDVPVTDVKFIYMPEAGYFKIDVLPAPPHIPVLYDEPEFPGIMEGYGLKILPDKSSTIDTAKVEQCKKAVDEINAMPLKCDTISFDPYYDRVYYRFEGIYFDKKGKLRKYFRKEITNDGAMECSMTSAYYNENGELVYISFDTSYHCGGGKEFYYVDKGNILYFEIITVCECCDDEEFTPEEINRMRPVIGKSLKTSVNWQSDLTDLINADKLLKMLKERKKEYEEYREF
jgi:hypothetical protein